MSDKPKAVVVHSGGMDSTTLLYQVLHKGYETFALTFDYGQRHKKEIQYAENICKELGISWRLADLSAISPLLSGSALTSPDIKVPEGHYADENMKLTVVPNRNAIMLAIAVGYAVSIKAEAVFVGVHAGDHPIYPDCRPEFIKSFNRTAQLGTEGHAVKRFRINAPFLYMKKKDIVSVGMKLGVPYEKTWSCYKGGERHCGKCGTCVERKEAFKLAKIADPTPEYEDETGAYRNWEKKQ